MERRKPMGATGASDKLKLGIEACLIWKDALSYISRLAKGHTHRLAGGGPHRTHGRTRTHAHARTTAHTKCHNTWRLRGVVKASCCSEGALRKKAAL